MQHLKRRHKKMHKSPILKNKISPKKSAKEPKKRAVSKRLVAHRTVLSSVHPTVRWSTRQSAQRGHKQALSGCSTGLSGGAPDSRHRTVRCAPDCPVCTGQTATVGSNGRLLQADVACTGHCTLAVRWCTGLSGAPDDRKLLLSVQRLVWGLEAINTTPTSHSQVWKPKQHTKAYSAHFQELKNQVLNRITR
jgi:hypothetical protein